ncbi:MAG TPA: D-alanyl-D-alanine carboxypeptidase family protein [Oscillospiraceae bacterium]|nr:D-alanyl-D-alanine carboxypeptidase family protein [Oscillospiraceae bacterium]
MAKKGLSLILALLVLILAAFPAYGDRLVTQEEIDAIVKETDIQPAVTIHAKSAILIERRTGIVLFEDNADMQTAPASITKIMTLLLVMEAMEEGKFALDTQVVASEHACSMGGSQLWLEPGEVMTVDELLRASAIASANDTSVALAELVSGSEEAFANRMNERAAELGMTGTVFKNATGLDAEGHLSTARDIAIMSAELLKHELIKKYTTVWMDSLRDGETELTNTNRLVRFYKGCTGLKTGSTDGAGCCLSASAERDGMELISVTLGSSNNNERFAAARKLLDFGFANYEVASPVYIGEAPEAVRVHFGTADAVPIVFGEAEPLLLAKGESKNLTQTIELVDSMEAPVAAGDPVGKVTVELNGEYISEYPVLAAEAVDRMTFFKAFGLLVCEAVSTKRPSAGEGTPGTGQEAPSGASTSEAQSGAASGESGSVSAPGAGNAPSGTSESSSMESSPSGAS